MTLTQTSRDSLIIEDYQGGTEVPEIARQNGLSPRRVQQILRDAKIPLRSRRLGADRPPISTVHERVGRMLTTYLFEHEIQPNEAANSLGWSFQKVRLVQSGVTELELLDLMDLASYVGRDISEMIKNG